MLYEYSTLNKADFKSGRYVMFEKIDGDFSNVSRYINGIYVPKFYKIQFYHQLNNGYLDLTNDIWEKYNQWPTKNSTHWCNDSNFKYYCPSQYKGKIASDIQIEDLYKFQLNKIPVFKLNDDLNYDLDLSIDTSLKINVVPGVGCIKFTAVKFEYIIDNITTVVDPFIPVTPTTTFGVSDITNLSILGISKDNQNKVMEYKITPVLGTIGSTNTYSDNIDNIDLKDFFDSHTISGKIRISTEFEGATFTPVLRNTTCNVPDGTKYINEYIFSDDNGNYLNPSYEISLIPYIFLRDGTSPVTEDAIVINTYTVLNYKAKLTLPLTDVVDAGVLTLFEQTTVEIPSPECVESPTINLTINFNIPLSTGTIIEVGQEGFLGEIRSGLTTSSEVFSISKNLATTIRIHKSGFAFIDLSNLVYTTNTTINIAFIADVKLNVQGDINSPSGYYWIDWVSLENLPIIYGLEYTAHFIFSADVVISLPKINNYSYSSMEFDLENELDFRIEYISLNSTTDPLTLTYANISDNSLFGEINNVIFKKIIT